MGKRKQILVTCSNEDCKKEFLKDQSEVNRNKKLGRNNYCGLSCNGKSNHKHLSKYVETNIKYIRSCSDNRKDKYTGLREHFRRVKRRHHEYNITLDDLLNQWELQKGICIYSGVKLNHPKDGGDNLTIASLDRVDPNKGYVKGNIQFISIACNHAKNNMSHEDMLQFCEIIYLHNQNKDISLIK